MYRPFSSQYQKKGPKAAAALRDLTALFLCIIQKIYIFQDAASRRNTWMWKAISHASVSRAASRAAPCRGVFQ